MDEVGGRWSWTCGRGDDELAVEREVGMVVEDLRTQLASAEGAGDVGDDVAIYLIQIDE